MPRGSKPGERRGGRQKGTPNKKTLLRNAAINAAATNPNVSPLDFLLGLMRNPDLPSDLRVKIAEVAAPFVHRKPTKDNPAILAPRKHVALMKAVHKGKQAQSGAADAKAGTSDTIAAEAAEEESPLEYLMGVMRDPDTEPEIRIRVARTLMPFAHPKRKRDPKADKAEAELTKAREESCLRGLRTLFPKQLPPPLPDYMAEDRFDLLPAEWFVETQRRRRNQIEWRDKLSNAHLAPTGPPGRYCAARRDERSGF
jgi:hypothetical protein